MVWFQCEDCGENLKKPKLPNHFRMCSAYKLSCIDCGLTFNRESVQTHTQCISEAEKYGPKGQAKVANDVQAKPNKPKPNADVDVNVGLSSHPPWHCSLCNTSTTSHQTLQLHADGKKHRAKARAFHAAQKQSNQTEEPSRNEEAVGNGQKVESVNGADNKMQERKLQKDSNREGNESQTRKRKVDSSEDGLKEKSGKGNACDFDGRYSATSCTQEYGGPGTLLVIPFLDMADTSYPQPKRTSRRSSGCTSSSCVGSKACRQ